MNTNYKDRKTIFGKDKEAFDEFLAGKERWNAYVKKHGDDTEVDFSGVDSSKHRKGNGEFNFSGYLFPKEGNVIFSRSIFGDGGVNFTFANFGKGDVYFCNVNFGDGYVNFDKAKFLGKGFVSFKEAEFGDGDIGFCKAKFGKGAVEFNRAQFGDGYVKFSHAKFGNGDLEFKGAKFGNGKLNFEHCEFKGYVSFQSLKFSERLSKFSLRHSSFDKSLKSAHRYVIQKRLKLSGAWWKSENVESMLALRVVRGNEQWDEYWRNLAKAS